MLSGVVGLAARLSLPPVDLSVCMFVVLTKGSINLNNGREIVPTTLGIAGSSIAAAGLFLATTRLSLFSSSLIYPLVFFLSLPTCLSLSILGSVLRRAK